MESKNAPGNREMLASRIGFILLAAGCAVGLGNVWRFPFITGKYGGGVFVLLYLIFLLILGFPLLVMELAIGRGGRANLAVAYRKLAARSSGFWSVLGKIVISGNLLLLMYYSVVTGWLCSYVKYYLCGKFSADTTAAGYGAVFGALTASPGGQLSAMTIAVAICTGVCMLGLKQGVERVVKYMMMLLLLLVLVLAGKALFMPGAAEGLRFYLIPNWQAFSAHPFETVFAAMGQAFFTLSLGIGSMAIFGSYSDRSRRLAGDAVHVIAVDTFIALLSGVIIFPVCYSFGVEPGAGPSLIFVAMPNVFGSMAGGRFFGALFFIFLAIAALTTLIAVMENLLSYLMDAHRFSRKAAALFTGIVVAVLSVPCALGFNLWKGFQPFGEGTSVLDLEDFILSQNILPLGGLAIAIFCGTGLGWGWKVFMDEANAGSGIRYGNGFAAFSRWIVPVLIIAVMICGYWQFFHE